MRALVQQKGRLSIVEGITKWKLKEDVEKTSSSLQNIDQNRFLKSEKVTCSLALGSDTKWF